MPPKPELALPKLWLNQHFDVQKLGWLDEQASLFVRFARSGFVQLLGALHAAARRDPEVIAARPLMPNEKNALVVFNDHACGDAVLQCEA